MIPSPAITAARQRFTTAPWKLAGAAACGCVALALIDPTKTAVTPPCPLRAMTGWWCPLCGGTRAVSRLVRGDLSGAFRFNALVVALLPAVFALWVSFAFPGRLPRISKLRSDNQRFVLAVFALFAVFMVVRNLPFGYDWLRHPGA